MKTTAIKTNTVKMTRDGNSVWFDQTPRGWLMSNTMGDSLDMSSSDKEARVETLQAAGWKAA